MVRLHPDFPQVVDYRFGLEQLPGRIGNTLDSVSIDGTAHKVAVGKAVVSSDQRSVDYPLTIPELQGVAMTVRVSVKDRTLRA